jgi:ferrous iron transport protein B
MRKLDKLFLHPWLGPLILFALLFVVFQAVFAWATPFADALEAGIGWLTDLAQQPRCRPVWRAIC